MRYTNSHQENASKLHRKVLDCFKRECPEWRVVQEKAIDIDGQKLFCDFMCESPFKFIIEVQGRQHFEYVPHFHGTTEKFASQQANDKKKKAWADMNGYAMVYIQEKGFNEDILVDLIMEVISA